MIKVNKIGKILNGKYKNWNIVIYYDSKDTGGYYVLTWSNSEGYDDWFESLNEAKSFVNKDYIIEWSNQDYVP